MYTVRFFKKHSPCLKLLPLEIQNRSFYVITLLFLVILSEIKLIFIHHELKLRIYHQYCRVILPQCVWMNGFDPVSGPVVSG